MLAALQEPFRPADAFRRPLEAEMRSLPCLAAVFLVTRLRMQAACHLAAILAALAEQEPTTSLSEPWPLPVLVESR